MAKGEGDMNQFSMTEQPDTSTERTLALVAHDLRAPLQAISAAADLLLEELAGDEHAAALHRIQSSTSRMARMIEQLLDASRFQLGAGPEIIPQHTDLAGACRRAIDECTTGRGEGQVALEARGVTSGWWDRDRMDQVLSNLIDNAIEHRSSGSRVVVRVDGSRADRVTLLVWNQGVIPREVRAHLFTPFCTSRGGRRANRCRGLGLGLAITRQIVLAHDGVLEVHSDEKTGTAFLVELPRDARAATRV
jgi:signal transduction histidine kinase